jgi:hypothetical protein
MAQNGTNFCIQETWEVKARPLKPGFTLEVQPTLYYPPELEKICAKEMEITEEHSVN